MIDKQKQYFHYRRIKLLVRQGLVLAVTALVGASVFLISHYNSTSLESNTEVVATTSNEISDEDWDKIENGIHVRTGLIDGEGLMTVVSNCTSCHSAKLLTQNRMTAERWNETIKWMQETQNLWDLGDNQEIIVKYLTTYYPYKKKGRRAILTDIDWYELED